MPLSIIIPVYNHAKELEECVESILAQTIYSHVLKNMRVETEIIVVNDGSTDEISNIQFPISKKLEGAGFVVQWINQENKGAAVARNVGFHHSSGEYLLFCDADIRLYPGCLEKMLAALKANPDAAFAYSQFRFGFKIFHSYPFDPQRLRELNYIHTSSLIRRSCFSRFDDRLKKFQDWDLFLTIVQKGGRGVFIPEVLFGVAAGGTMSQWMPSFAYRLPWKYSPWVPEVIGRYQEAKEIIVKKHNIQFPIPNSQ